jgi:integrase
MLAIKDGITLHGFRSSFRDWCGAQTNPPIERELAEEALAHEVGGQVENSYRREQMIERRRVIMERWSRFCAGAEVVELKPRRRARA